MTTPECDPERVETVARAIHDDDCDCEKWPCAWTADRRYRRLAAAAIAALPPSPAEEAVNGVALIAAERRRQIEAEGWTPGHDAEHDGHDLAMAAVSYATPHEYRDGLESPGTWPWCARDWKPTPGDRVRELVKAGALIAAEIDRLRAALEVS